MIDPVYRAQVDLLLKVLPYVAEEETLALKGGTAINLFARDFPRLSVDIDLTYLPFDDRKTALKNIADALGRIKTRIERAIPGIRVAALRQSDGQLAKLDCQFERARIKIEVNTTMRGHIQPVRLMQVAAKVQEEFKSFAAINVVSHGELYGGKICAALDRQHPRDLFDIAQLLENEGFSEEIRQGFIACLLSSDRPISEMISPNFHDQSEAFQNKFAGMALVPFTYRDFEATRERLVKEVNTGLTESDREFLLSFKSGEPEWNLIPLPALKDMPAVQWKLHNIQNLKKQNPAKHAEALKALRDKLSR